MTLQYILILFGLWFLGLISVFHSICTDTGKVTVVQAISFVILPVFPIVGLFILLTEILSFLGEQIKADIKWTENNKFLNKTLFTCKRKT